MKIKPGEIIGELVGGDVPADEAEYFYRIRNAGRRSTSATSARFCTMRTPVIAPCRFPDRRRLGGPRTGIQQPSPHIRPMSDPISPEILAWLETLPLSDRLTMLHAMALVFPQLQRSHDWKARIATVRAALRPTTEALGDILKEASRRGEMLKGALAA